MKNLCLISFVLLLSLNLTSTQQQLQMVIEVSHHGTSSPRYSDPWNNWESLGDIIPAGIRQHYVLGSGIDSIYANIIPEPYSPGSVYIRAIDSNRTIESAYSQAYALFTVGDQAYAPQFNANYNQTLANPPLNGTVNQTINGSAALPNSYTPVAVHTENPQFDHLLRGFSADTCPYQANLTMQQITTLYAQQTTFLSQVQPLVDNAVYQGWVASTDSTSFDALYQTANLYEVLVSDYTAGLYTPMVPGTQGWANYEFLYVMLQNYLFYNNPLQSQLGSMNLLNQILNIFVNKTTGLRTESFIHYSAQDNNILSILTAFNQTSPICFYNTYTDSNYNNPVCDYPDHASVLFFELWYDPNNAANASVRVVYNNYVLYLCGTPTCDLNSFANVIAAASGGLQYTDYLSICFYGLPNAPSSGGSGFFRGLLIFLAVVLFVGLFYFTKTELYDPYMEISQQNQQAGGNYARQ